jgi:Cu(I)/Ag(I) efflux system membrane fusion protein
MANNKVGWRTWGVPLVVIVAAAAAIWYAYDRGWLVAKNEMAKSGGDDMAGMNMPGMPGMEMGSQSSAQMSEPSAVPGYAVVTIPAEVQQRIGVTMGAVEKGSLSMTVQTVGIIQPNETKISRIHLRTQGWVQRLFANFTGQAVQKDDPLLAIYSPDFLVSQENYLSARRADRSGTGFSGDRQSARRRLELLDVPDQDIDKLDKTGVAQEYITLRSPISGTVLEKNVQEKEYVTADKQLYLIADLSTIWVQAKVYEYELPHVELGQPVTVTVAALPNREFTGKVVFIQPTVEEPTRTVQVRVELTNDDGALKPGMFARMTISHAMGQGLLVPTSAIIRTGERDLAYRVKSPGEFVPVEVKIGDLKFGDRFQVLEGLDEGDQVVTSANFLIDSESRLREGGGGMAGMPGMEGMDMGGQKGADHSSMEKMNEPAREQSTDADHSQMQHQH